MHKINNLKDHLLSGEISMYGKNGSVTGFVLGGVASTGTAAKNLSENLFNGKSVSIIDITTVTVGLIGALIGWCIGWEVGRHMAISGCVQKKLLGRNVETLREAPLRLAHAVKDNLQDLLTASLQSLPGGTGGGDTALECRINAMLRSSLSPQGCQLVECIEALEQKEVPKKFPDNDNIHYKVLQYAGEIRARGHNMWAPVDMEWTTELAAALRGKKVLEVFAGRGWLAKALRAHGVEVIATDINPGETVTDVQQLDAVDAVNEYNADVLLMSWPPMGEDRAAQAYEAFQGKKVVYIGEMGSDGTVGETGNQRLIDYFSTIGDKKIIETPSPYPYIVDNKCYIFTRDL